MIAFLPSRSLVISPPLVVADVSKKPVSFIWVELVARGYNASMAREITQRELRNESGAIMRQLDSGESFVITRNGVPVGELTPARRQRFVAAATVTAAFAGAPGIDAD